MATSFSDWWVKVIGVLTRSWQPLLFIQLATVVPGMIIAAIVTAAAGTDSTVVSVGAAIVGVLGAIILFVVALLAQGASVYVVGKQASGQEVGAGPALTFAAGRALPLLGWGLLAGLLVMLGLIVLIIPGLYLIVVFAASLTGVIMFERAGIGRTFALVNPAFGQTLGRLLTFLLAAIVYSAIVGAIVSALVGPRGSWRTCCATSCRCRSRSPRSASRWSPTRRCGTGRTRRSPRRRCPRSSTGPDPQVKPERVL